VCRRGLIAKIRVTHEWQRQGYGTRMVRRAMRGCEADSWTTTGQSEDAQRFFPVLSAATGAAFEPLAPTCEHIRGGRRVFVTPRLEGIPTASRLGIWPIASMSAILPAPSRHPVRDDCSALNGRAWWPRNAGCVEQVVDGRW
jgi:hypothetical protein